MQRGFKGRYNEYYPLGERLISSFSYLSMGFIGFIWLIFSFVTGRYLSSFVKYNIYQSIFISILLYLFNIVVSILLAFVKIIPFFGSLIINLVYYLAQYPVFADLSLLNILLVVFIIYLTLMSIFGKFAFIPWISPNVRKMI